jgi:hypothetical protein
MKQKHLLCLVLVLSGGLFDSFSTAQSVPKSGRWPGPSLPAIADADPSIRHLISVEIPTRLRIERTADTLSVGIDTNSVESTNLLVGTNMVMGMRSDWYVYPVGQARPAKGGVGFSGLQHIVPPGMVNYWHTQPDGIPQAGKSYVVEIDLTAFETDIPPQHLWDPYDKNYRILWKRTLKQIVQ